MTEEERKVLIVAERFPNKSMDLWKHLLQTTLEYEGFDPVHLVPERAVSALQQYSFRGVVIDASDVDDPISLVRDIRGIKPVMPILVAKYVPSWRDGRDFFHAGASDVVMKSVNPTSMRTHLSLILTNPSNS